MKISSELSNFLGTQQTRQQETEQSGIAAKIARTRELAESKLAESGDAESDRETYGLLSLETMSNEQYNAFLRATANMTEMERVQAAQSLHALAVTYTTNQQLIQSGLVAHLQSEDGGFTPLSQFSGNDMSHMLQGGVEVLRQLPKEQFDTKGVVDFFKRYQYAMNSDSSVNLKG